MEHLSSLFHSSESMELFIMEIPKIDLKQAEKLGGFELSDWVDEQFEENKNYCDKGGHKERSIANQPNHKEHWKKYREP